MASKKILGLVLLTGGSCVGMAYAFHRMFVQRMTESPIYTEAMDIVRRHKGVINFLGEPLTQKDPVMANSGMLLAGYSDVQVRVAGPKSKGIVFLKVIQRDNKILVDSIHLQIGSDQSRRLVIKGSDKEQEKQKVVEKEQEQEKEKADSKKP